MEKYFKFYSSQKLTQKRVYSIPSFVDKNYDDIRIQQPNNPYFQIILRQTMMMSMITQKNLKYADLMLCLFYNKPVLQATASSKKDLK